MGEGRCGWEVQSTPHAVAQAEQGDAVSQKVLPVMLKGFRDQTDTIFLSSDNVIQ